MGVFSKGLYGAFTGKVGTMVGSTWKGLPVVKSRPARKKNRTFTQAQLEQQAKFALSINYMQQLNPLLNITFKNYAKEKTPLNSAMSYTISNAITGDYPDFAINWPALQVSRGKLPGVKDPTAITSPGKIDFTWLQGENGNSAKPADRSVLVAICPTLNECVFTSLGASRGTGTASLDVGNLVGEVVHTYLAFVSEDGKLTSNTVYTGQKTVA